MIVSWFQNQTQLLVLDKFSVFAGYEGLLSKGMLPTLLLSYMIKKETLIDSILKKIEIEFGSS